MELATFVEFMATNGVIVEDTLAVIKVEIIHRARVLTAALKIATQEMPPVLDKSQLTYICPPCTVVKLLTTLPLDNRD